MLESKETDLEKANQYLLKEHLKALEVSKETMEKQIISEHKNVRYLSGLLDKGKCAFYFSQLIFFVKLLGLLFLLLAVVWVCYLILNHSKIVFTDLGVLGVIGLGYLCLNVDFGIVFPKLSFYGNRMSVADDIVNQCDYLDRLQSELKKLEMKQKTIVSDSEGRLRYESFILVTQDRCYLEEIAKGCLRGE